MGASTPNKAALERAIAPLIPGFEADGFRVEVGAIEQMTVRINVHATSDSCRECLLPQDHLEAIFLQAFRTEGFDVKAVRVVSIDDQ